jgi:sugar/nucleoside kinase (ribokinase family)
MPSFDITIAGEINLDLILDGLPVDLPLDRELLASNFAVTLGSSSAIVAHNLAALGMKVGFITLVGTDPMGAMALDRLHDSGVNVTKTQYATNGASTGISILLTHPGARRVLTFPGTMHELMLEHLDLTFLKSSRHFHLSSLFLQKGLQPALPELFTELKQAGLTLSLDTNDDPDDRWQSGLDKLLPLIDIFLPNEDEALRITRTATAEAAAEALARIVPIVIIKCGSRGSLAQTGEDLWWTPPFAVTPVDTIGAGDSFNAGFLRAFLRGHHPAACAFAGNRIAALSTLHHGGTESFRNAEEMHNFLTTVQVAKA